MAEANFANRTLFRGDSLRIVRGAGQRNRRSDRRRPAVRQGPELPRRARGRLDARRAGRAGRGGPGR